MVALSLVLTLVIPQFEPIFAGQEDKLPALTRLVLHFSRAVNDHGLLLLCLMFGAPLLFWTMVRSAWGAQLLTDHRVRIPGLRMRDQYIAGQFTGILATLIGNGISVVNALPLARDAIGSRRWRGYIDKMEQSIRAGSRLSAAMTRGALLPRAAIRLIEVGEYSGQLAQTCRDASTVISETVRTRIERIVALANPIAIILLGGLVGILVAGVMLGIFSLGDFAG